MMSRASPLRAKGEPGVSCVTLRLGRRGSLAVSAGVVAHTLWTSAAPAMAYRLYADQWHLSHTVTTGIFAIYPIVVVAMLVGFGDLSDHIGRRSTMLFGLGASLAGAILFTIAPSVIWLFAARAMMGVGVGLTAGPSSAAVVEYSSTDRADRAALITTVAQAGGFAGALLLGGALIQYAPWPTRLSFLILSVLLSLLLLAVWFLPRQTSSDSVKPWRLRLHFVPGHARRAYTVAAIAMVTAYTHGVLVLSLGGQVAHDLVGSSNSFINSAMLSLFAISSGAVGIAGRSLGVRRAMISGALASAAGMGLLAFAVAHASLLVFLGATAISGGAYSLLFLSALEVINQAAPAHHRGGVLSAVYLPAYLVMGAVAVVLGLFATAKGLEFAVNLGLATIVALSLATFTLILSQREIGRR